MYNPESLETDKFLRDFEIQTDHLISARWPDLVIVNKKFLSNSELCRSGWPQGKTEGKWKENLQENWKKNYGTWKWRWYQL